MADVILSITIKDKHAARVLAAVVAQSGKKIFMKIEKENLNETIRTCGKSSWEYQKKQAGENNRQFVERMLRRFLIAFVKHYEYNLDKVRYNNEVSMVVLPDENVPDNIVV